MNGCAGFTLVELLTVVLILGILAGICIPNFHRSVVKARATSILADLHVIHVAVYTHQADQNSWPRDAG